MGRGWSTHKSIVYLHKVPLGETYCRLNIPKEKMEKLKVKMRAGNMYIPATIWEDNGRTYFKFPYSPKLIAEIKSLRGRRWHPDEKMWSAPIDARNEIALNFLIQGRDNPFSVYDAPWVSINLARELWAHQIDILNFMLTRRHCIVAAEQGTGKTLPLIELMERSGFDNDEIWYVAPKSGMEAVRLELKKWKARVTPRFMTYAGLTKAVNNLKPNDVLPHILIGDESSRVKGPNSQRSLAFLNLADAIREIHGTENTYVLLASGTPAPKSPIDWWQQCEICCPGFLKEGTADLLKRNLCLVEFVEGQAGMSFPQLVTWWDDENKCSSCGLEKNEGTHEACNRGRGFKKSVNEVNRLHKRMDGLVLVKRKADCLDLPDKYYQIINCEPTATILEKAENIVEFAETHVQALARLRALSDGFQYTQEEVGTKRCPICNGLGTSTDFVKTDDDEEWDDDDYSEYNPQDLSFTEVEGQCWKCEGSGEVPKFRRTYVEIATPKLDKVSEILDSQEDNGRLIIYAAFHASIDRLTELCLKKRWTCFVIDGRGWRGITPSGDKIKKGDLVEAFQDKKREHERVVWIAHPQSSGMGLTLTESPIEVFYSNTFNGEDRMQAEDRAHRPGMDLNKGLTIIDLVHLPTDQLVIENIENKVWLQGVTLGLIERLLKEKRNV